MDPLSVTLVGKLVIVFAALLISLRAGLKLTKSLLIAIATTIVLYAIPLKSALHIWYGASTSLGTGSIVLILYLITLLQRILQNRDQLKQVHKNLDILFNSRRITATVAPIFIGLLPSAAAMLICGEIVRDTVGDSLDVEEQAFITSYFRHIPESFLPTYAAVIMMSELTGVPIGAFVLGMLPLEVLLYVLGYWAFIRKIPKETGLPPSGNRGRQAIELLKNLWSIIAIIILVIGFHSSVLSSTLVVILVCLPVYRYSFKEILHLMKTAFEAPMLINTYLIMVFKDYILHSGSMEALPDFFSHLPVPTYFVFALIFFFGTVVAGAQAIIAICAVMAFAAIPGGGMPLMVLLMSFAYAAMQISPTHICLFIAADDFGVPMMAIVRKTIPVIAIFCALTIPYYWLLATLF